MLARQWRGPLLFSRIVGWGRRSIPAGAAHQDGEIALQDPNRRAGPAELNQERKDWVMQKQEHSPRLYQVQVSAWARYL